MRITDNAIYFWGSFLSNFIPSDLSIIYDGHTFTNSEQLFMYLKAVFFKDTEKAREIIIRGQDPRVAKRLGREVCGYNETEWSKVRESIMYKACMLKFQSNEELVSKLLETGNKTLVEGTPFDPIWGVMIKWDDDRILDERNWRGQNLLGKVLMKVRNDIQLKQSDR